MSSFVSGVMTETEAVQLYLEGMRNAAEQSGLPLIMLLRLTTALAARLAVGQEMPLDAFELLVRDAYDIQRRDREAWLRQTES